MSRSYTAICGLISAVLLAITSQLSHAQATNSPEVGGQLNKEWGNSASTLAKDGDSDVTGGGMGAHSRSTKAADINGGFANSENAFGITNNVKDGGGNAGRRGVGNVSRGQPHNTHPGDGGNGQHGLNNSALSNVVDPVTGDLAGD